MVIVVEFKISG